MPNSRFHATVGVDVRSRASFTRTEQVREFIGRFADISTFTEKLRISDLPVFLLFFRSLPSIPAASRQIYRLSRKRQPVSYK